jgi:hypothetical protein
VAAGGESNAAIAALHDNLCRPQLTASDDGRNAGYPGPMPFFICPRCKNRRMDNDGREGLSQEPPSCQKCNFGFMFELLEDYYPAQATGFVVCDHDARILASGRGIFELTGFDEGDLMGKHVAEAFNLSDTQPIETVREWGVRQLGKELSVRTSAGIEKKVVVDFFPAYDEDRGLLVALTPE